METKSLRAWIIAMLACLGVYVLALFSVIVVVCEVVFMVKMLKKLKK